MSLLPDPLRRFGKPVSHGFTLLELLVVITIIAILAALSMAAINRVMQTARETKALVPLRTIAAAGVAYSGQNNGQINTLKYKGDPLEGEGGQYVSSSFWGRMQPYVFSGIKGGSQSALGTELKQQIGGLFSTGNPDKMTGTLLQGGKIYHDTSGLPVPFAFNSHLYEWNKWVTAAQLGGLSQVMYLTYGFGVFDETDASVFVEYPTDGTAPKSNIAYLPSQKAMVLFLDGHVEMLAPPIAKHLFFPTD